MHKSLRSVISNSRPRLHRFLCPNLPSSHPRLLSISQLANSPLTRHSHVRGTMAMPRPLSTIATSEMDNGADDDTRYRPFLLDEKTRSSDWISALELDTATEMARQNFLATSQPLRVLVLYGSLRTRCVYAAYSFPGSRSATTPVLCCYHNHDVMLTSREHTDRTQS